MFPAMGTAGHKSRERIRNPQCTRKREGRVVRGDVSGDWLVPNVTTNSGLQSVIYKYEKIYR